MTYTLAQARAFAEAAARDDCQREAALANALRMAFGADVPAWKQYLQSLQR